MEMRKGSLQCSFEQATTIDNFGRKKHINIIPNYYITNKENEFELFILFSHISCLPAINK